MKTSNDKKRIGFYQNFDLNDNFDKEKISLYTDYLISWIKTMVNKAKAKGVIFGLSGGIDSALIAALSQKAFPENHLAVIMPIDSMKHEENDLKAIEKNLNLKTKTINLEKTFLSLNQEYGDLSLLAKSNIKPRLRMTTLYALAQNLNYLVLGTDNFDEYFIGYFTKFGDGGADLLPISHLLKSEVKAMAQFLNVPNSVITKKPSAGLWENQSDEDELGFTYHELDNYLIGNDVEQKTKEKIEKLHVNSQHKRDHIYRPLSIEEFLNQKGEK